MWLFSWECGWDLLQLLAFLGTGPFIPGRLRGPRKLLNLTTLKTPLPLPQFIAFLIPLLKHVEIGSGQIFIQAKSFAQHLGHLLGVNGSDSDGQLDIASIHILQMQQVHPKRSKDQKHPSQFETRRGKSRCLQPLQRLPGFQLPKGMGQLVFQLMQELQRTTGTLFNVPACLQCLTKHGDGPWIVPGCQDTSNRLPMPQVPRVLITVHLHFVPGLNQAWMNETLQSGGGAIQLLWPPLHLKDHVPSLLLLSPW